MALDTGSACLVVGDYLLRVSDPDVTGDDRNRVPYAEHGEPT